MNTYKKYESKGLVIIAMHRGMAKNVEIALVPFEKKWPFPVYSGGSVKGNDKNTNPQSFIFNSKGELVFDSRFETDTDKALLKAAAEAPDWLAGDKAISKLSAQQKAVLSRKDFGKTLLELEEKEKSEDAAEKEEAAYLAERLENYAEWLNAKAVQKLNDGKPTECLEVLKEISVLFKGHEIGKKAEDQSAEKKKDDAFKKELAAEGVAKTIEKTYFTIKPRQADEDGEKWKKRNARPFGQIKGSLETLKKTYSSTKVFQAVSGMVAELGLE